jgi:hypothetical protein
MTHARRVMDKNELDTVTKLFEEFKLAIDGTEGKVLPEDEAEKKQPLDIKQMRSVLKKTMTKNEN